MKTSIRLYSLTLISFATALATRTSAQVTGAAGNAAVHAAPGAPAFTPVTPPNGNNTAMASANAATNAAAAANNAASATAAYNAAHAEATASPSNAAPNTAVSVANSSSLNAAANAAAINGPGNSVIQPATGAVSPVITSNVSPSSAATLEPNGFSASATSTTGVSANGQVVGTNLAAGAAGSISASLNSTTTTRDINNSSRANRDAVLSSLDTNLSTSQRAMSDLRTSSRPLSGEALNRFNAAYTDVGVQEQNVRRDLTAVRNANEDNYAIARAQLASDYDAYAQSIARAEAAAQNSTAVSTGVTGSAQP